MHIVLLELSEISKVLFENIVAAQNGCGVIKISEHVFLIRPALQ
jgi:hypothetical protein